MPLMVVESPKKIKTLAKLAPDNWSFAATRGHLYDLPEDDMGLDDSYQPQWVPLSRRPVENLRQKAKNQQSIFLATDPDREGEAIAWQVQDLVLSGMNCSRLRLNAITREELEKQLDDPGRTDMRRVHSQWARRILDRLVGYRISPFLMRAFKGKKLSAGRVQSAVLARIVQQWEDYDNFDPETYYQLYALLLPDNDQSNRTLRVNLIELDNQTLGTGEEELLLTNRERVENLLDMVETHGLTVDETEIDQTESHPRFPFESSSLIRCASDWFGWSSGKTMGIAQSLYESGLITYHRSDSTRISRTGCGKAKGFITEQYGEQYHQWRGGGGGEQEGHEAIRAENPYLKPSDLKYVSGDRELLYTIIWQRYVRSQMVPARWDRWMGTFHIPETDSSATFQGKARTCRELGFYRCRRTDEDIPPDKEWTSEQFEQLVEAHDFTLQQAHIEESETSGPQPFTEGRLVTMMKDEGIGRPSTYQSTIERLRQRGYIEDENEWIKPTPRGIDVCHFLNRAIPPITSVKLTEEMEQSLDRIAQGDRSWQEFVEGFDGKLDKWLKDGEDVEPEGTAERAHEKLEFEVCPRCDSDLILREGKYGPFVHCDSDECDFTANPPAKTYTCPECSRHMVKQKGRKSTYYSCIASPDCQGKRPVGQPHSTYDEFMQKAPDCPECAKKMTLRKGRYGKFWGCTSYPDCEGKRSYQS